jgi:hypothetical protein
VAQVNVYVDGFNLYFGALKDHPELKWLDLSALAGRLLNPGDTVHRIRYFTARIDSRGDPRAPQRQETYLRALRTTPNLSIEYGQFKTTTKHQRLVNPRRKDPTRVEVYRTEEKGSDVNLATFLLWDAFEREGAVSLVISGDTDLVRPIELVVTELGRPVGVVNGTLNEPPPRDLQRVASWVKRLRIGALRDSQFAETLADADGEFRRPSAWSPQPRDQQVR